MALGGPSAPAWSGHPRGVPPGLPCGGRIAPLSCGALLEGCGRRAPSGAARGGPGAVQPAIVAARTARMGGGRPPAAPLPNQPPNRARSRRRWRGPKPGRFLRCGRVPSRARSIAPASGAAEAGVGLPSTRNAPSNSRAYRTAGHTGQPDIPGSRAYRAAGQPGIPGSRAAGHTGQPDRRTYRAVGHTGPPDRRTYRAAGPPDIPGSRTRRTYRTAGDSASPRPPPNIARSRHRWRGRNLGVVYDAVACRRAPRSHRTCQRRC